MKTKEPKKRDRHAYSKALKSMFTKYLSAVDESKLLELQQALSLGRHKDLNEEVFTIIFCINAVTEPKEGSAVIWVIKDLLQKYFNQNPSKEGRSECFWKGGKEKARVG